MIGKEQLVEFLEGIVMKDELGDIVTIEQIEEISRKLVARIDVQQGQLDGLQSMIGAMQVKITQLQLQMVKMEEKLADKESEIVAAREKAEEMSRQMAEQNAELARREAELEARKKAVAAAEEVKPAVVDAKPAVVEVVPAPIAEYEPVEENVPVVEEVWEEEPVQEHARRDPQEETKERGGNQTIADSIKGEESLAEKLSKRVDHETVASTINSSKIDRIQTAITIADRFRFQRELFGGDAVKMAEIVEKINNMKNLDEALGYIEKNFNWDVETQVARDFLRLVERRFL